MKVGKLFTGNTLKYIATASMIIDHVGLSFFPEIQWMRIIGRIAFPIFAFLLVEGFVHTKSREKYITTMLIAGVLSEIPFDLFVHNEPINFSGQNVMWTFAAGLVAMYTLESKIKAWKKITIILSVFIGSVYLSFNYMSCGIMTIAAFYMIRHNKDNQKLSKITMGIGLVLFIYGQITIPSSTVSIFGINIYIQLFALLALPIIALYNGQRGKNNPYAKYIFYLFYPFHMLLLWVLRVYIAQ